MITIIVQVTLPAPQLFRGVLATSVTVTLTGFKLRAASGFGELTISGLLGHAPRGVTQRYIHLDTALVIAADLVAGEIARLLNGGEVLSVRDIKRKRAKEMIRLVS